MRAETHVVPDLLLSLLFFIVLQIREFVTTNLPSIECECSLTRMQ